MKWEGEAYSNILRSTSSFMTRQINFANVYYLHTKLLLELQNSRLGFNANKIQTSFIIAKSNTFQKVFGERETKKNKKNSYSYA